MKKLRKKKIVKLSGILGIVLLLGASGYLLYARLTQKNPLPAEIKDHVSFKVLYPASVKLAPIESTSYVYQSQENVLNFTVNFAGAKIVFSQQPSPSSLGSDDQPYYQAIGIHPSAQFSTKLGLVALTKFWETGSLDPSGQSAVLATKGTLLTANTTGSLTNQQWKELFDSLKITQ